MNTLLTYLESLPKQVFGVDAILAAIGVGTLLALLIIWSLAWKGCALWKAARNGSKVWFVFLLLVNSIGLLDIIYIYLIKEKKK